MGRWPLVAWVGLGLLACSPAPADATTVTDSPGATGATPTGTTGEPGSSTGTGAGSGGTFGNDGLPDEGAEVGFVPPLDVACSSASSSSPHCALCSVREQNCVDAFKCAPWAEDGGDAWTGTRCIEEPREPAGVGEPCSIDLGLASGQDDCAGGSMCWAADPGTGEGRCVPFCAPLGEEPECPAGTGCMIDGPGALALCLPPCDPLDPIACSGDESCRFFSDSDAAYCIPNAGAVVLSPTIQCGSAGDACPPEAVCVTAATVGGCGAPTCCSPWCDLDDPQADSECAAARPRHVCVPVFDRGPAANGLAHLGVCALSPA